MIETFGLLMKSCEKIDCYSCINNVQLHVHSRNYSLKFKLLYLLNHRSY